VLNFAKKMEISLYLSTTHYNSDDPIISLSKEVLVSINKFDDGSSFFFGLGGKVTGEASWGATVF
jgi:hypothetical protein